MISVVESGEAVVVAVEASECKCEKQRLEGSERSHGQLFHRLKQAQAAGPSSAVHNDGYPATSCCVLCQAPAYLLLHQLHVL
jgi:hypothetical protein